MTQHLAATGEFWGYWWRFSSYERRGGHIRPTPGATLLKYNPWDDYEYVQPGQGGRRRTPPYLSLIRMIEDEESTPTSAKQRQRRSQRTATVLDWCGQYGLLGMFFLEVRQVTLYPRWEVNPGFVRPLATRRQFIRNPTRWTDKRIGGSQNLEALTLPIDQKPIGCLVPRQYWDKGWEEPGVLVLDVNTSTYLRRSISDVFREFFPSVPPPDLETYSYPVPTTDEFWALYEEDHSEFLRVASRFANIIRTMAKMKPANELTLEEQQSILQATEELQALAAQTSPALYTQKDGTFLHQWVPTSLLASFAMMALLDAAQGLINLCDNCDRVFISSAGRARYCSPQCRKTNLQREYRSRLDQKNTESKG